MRRGAQPNTAKLKADAQKVVGIIKGDKAKNETFCQMVIVRKAIDEAIQEKDNKKAAELAQKLSDLEENLGPEYIALVEAFRNIPTTRRLRRSSRHSIRLTSPVRINSYPTSIADEMREEHCRRVLGE